MTQHEAAPSTETQRTSESLPGGPATLFGALSEPCTLLLAAAAAYFEKSAVDPELRGEFWAARNAVAYRFTACAEAAEGFASSVDQHGAAPPQPHRYTQERDFFHFVLGGMASLEALHYGVHAWGACRGLTGFVLNSDRDRRRAVPKATLIAVQRSVDGQALAAELKRIQEAQATQSSTTFAGSSSTGASRDRTSWRAG